MVRLASRCFVFDFVPAFSLLPTEGKPSSPIAEASHQHSKKVDLVLPD